MSSLNFVPITRLFMIVVLMLLTVMPISAQQDVDLSDTNATVLTEAHLADIDAYVTDTMERFDIPGVTIALVQNGEIIHTNGFGVRELGSDVPVNSDTLFIIGSVPKSMTAMMIGTLVDEGVLGWDTPVSEVLPSFTLADPESSRTVTFRDLLSMRSGLISYHTALFMQPYSPQQILDTLANIPLVGKPGEAYAYSNQGYAAAGFIAAVAAGAQVSDNLYEAYADLMQQRVFDPIGMGRIIFDFDAGVSDPNHASPHSLDMTNGGFATFPVELECGGFSVIPAGGSTWSNAEDLARYLITQMNHGVAPDGERVISEQRLLDTWQPEIPTPNGTHFALGWVVKPEFHGLQQIEYGGGNLGYTSFVSFLPEANLGVVVLTNRIAGDGLTGAVTQYVYETAFGLDHEADAQYTAEEEGFQGMVAQMRGGIVMQTDPETVAAYLGDYELGGQGRFNDSGEFVLTGAFGDFPLYAIPGQPDTFLLGLAFGVGVQFAEDGSSFTMGAGESQPPVTVTRLQ